MVLVGHRANNALQNILFNKTFRMSAASNKDYSSGETMNVIHRDAGRVWSFVWDLSRVIECPFDLIISSYFLYRELGYTSLMTVVIYVALWFINKYKSKLHR